MTPKQAMTIHTTRDGSAMVRVTVVGSMTIYEAAEHKAELLAALADAAELEVDLGGVDEADTAGLQLLLLTRREADRAGQPLRIASLSPVMSEVLQRYGLQAAFAVSPSR